MPKIFVRGQYVADAPEGTTPEVARQIADLHRPPSYLDRGREILGQIAQAVKPAPKSTIPRVGGGAVVGLGLKGTMGVLDTIQQGQQADASNELQRQAQRDQNMNLEKERQKDIKAHQLKLNNDLAERKLMTTAQQHAQTEATARTQTKEAAQTERTRINAAKPVVLSPGAALTNPADGTEIAWNAPLPEQFNLSPGQTRYQEGMADPVATAAPQPEPMSEKDRLELASGFSTANAGKSDAELRAAFQTLVDTGMVPEGFNPPTMGSNSTLIHSTYVDVNPETGRQRRMAVMKDGSTKMLGEAPEGFTYQTDANGNVVALNKNNPQAPQSVPTPAPPANGTPPLQGDLPAGAMTEAQKLARYNEAYKVAAASDFDWETKSEEQKDVAVRALLAQQDAYLSGKPVAAPTAARPGQFTGKDGKTYIDNGDGTATEVE